MNTLKSALEGVEKERDYYFSKLREVELLCQDPRAENAQLVEQLMEILYASDEQVGSGTVCRVFGWRSGRLPRAVRPEKDLCLVTRLECGSSEVFTPRFSI